MLALKGILKNMAKGKKRKGSRDTRVAKKKPVTKKLESSKAGTDKTVPSKRVKRKVVATNKQNGVYSAMKSSISVIDFEPRRRSRRNAEANRLCRPSFVSVFEQNYTDGGAVRGRGKGQLKSKSPLKREAHVVKKRRTKLSPQSYRRPPAPALCGVEGADAIGSLLEFDMDNKKGWLSGALMDYIFCIFARKYKKVVFLPTMFAAHDLHRAHVENRIHLMKLTDVLGNIVDTRQVSRIIFCYNILNRHWNVVQIVLRPIPELQLFEPMGKPNRRSNIPRNGVSARSLPRRTYDWLEATWPMASLIDSIDRIGNIGRGTNRSESRSIVVKPTSWTQASTSAVTSQHQLTSFDCGVACLLYTEKLASGQNRMDVDRWTDQSEITWYRSLLDRTLANTVLKVATPRND